MRLTVSQEEILKCNILQYSLTRERRSEERWERRKRRRMAKRGWVERGRGSERERERLGLLPRLNIGTPTASSFAHFLSIFFPMFVLRLAPSHYFSHSLGGSYLTTVICISILLKKISNKVSRAAPSWGRPASPHPLCAPFPAVPSESVLQVIFRDVSKALL